VQIVVVCKLLKEQLHREVEDDYYMEDAGEQMHTLTNDMIGCKSKVGVLIFGFLF
jgi:hypothetical protein